MSKNTSDSDPALRFTFVIQVGTQYLDPARECPILEKRKMKLCGVGLPKVKWWKKKQNQKKHLGLHTQSREQWVKRFPQLLPSLFLSLPFAFSPCFPLMLLSSRQPRWIPHTPCSSPLRRGPLVLTATLPKYPSPSWTTRLYKVLLSLMWPIIQHECSTGTWKPGCLCSHCFASYKALPPTSQDQSGHASTFTCLDPTAGPQNQNALARHVLFEVTPLPS